MHRQVGQHPAIQLDTGFLQAGDELAVGHSLGPGLGVDTRDPEGPEITLLDPAVPVGVLACLGDRLFGDPVDPAAGTVVTLGLLENFFVATVCLCL